MTTREDAGIILIRKTRGYTYGWISDTIVRWSDISEMEVVKKDITLKNAKTFLRGI